MAMSYEPIAELDTDQFEAAIIRNEPDELITKVLYAAWYPKDKETAQGICVKLAGHENFNVRGNVLLGLAHITRIHGKLDEGLVGPLIASGMNDRNK